MWPPLSDRSFVLDWLRTSGCDIGQGYFIARPMAAAAFGDWVAGDLMLKDRGTVLTPEPAVKPS